MKKNSKYIVLTAAIALCAGSSLPFLAGSSTLNPERDSVKSEVPYCVTSPSVPDKITFAGQAIDLLRYDHRERMDRELMSFTYMHSTTMFMVKRANRYFPVIEPILKANGLPDDFKYLAVIESNLKPACQIACGCRRPMAVHACHRTRIRTGGEQQHRRTIPYRERDQSSLQVPERCLSEIRELAVRSRCLQCRARTHLHTATEANGRPGCRLMAGRRNFTLHVSPAGSQSRHQQSATVRFSVETGTSLSAHPLHGSDRHNGHCQPGTVRLKGKASPMPN